MFGKKQDQAAGAGAMAIQAQGSVSISVGMSAEEFRAYSLDLFHSEFFKFLGMAQDLAEARARKVVDDFLEEFATEAQASNREEPLQADDPGFAYALLGAQKAYARTGDEELEKALVRLLVDRAGVPKTGLRRIVLDECFEVLPKLTDSQMAVLALIFLVRYAKPPVILGRDGLVRYLDAFFCPIAKHVDIDRFTLNHLRYANCGAPGVEIDLLPAHIRDLNVTAMQGGFNLDDGRLNGLEEYEAVIREHFIGKDQGGKVDVIMLASPRDLYAKFRNLALPWYVEKQIQEWLQFSMKDAIEIVTLFETKAQYMLALVRAWSDSDMRGFELTTVGMAVAHLYLRQRGVPMQDLSGWI